MKGCRMNSVPKHRRHAVETGPCTPKELGHSLLTLGLIMLLPLQLLSAAGPVTYQVLAPDMITDLVGTHTGSVGALSVKDQSGTDNDPAEYVQFGVPEGENYQGYR